MCACVRSWPRYRYIKATALDLTVRRVITVAVLRCFFVAQLAVCNTGSCMSVTPCIRRRRQSTARHRPFCCTASVAPWNDAVVDGYGRVVMLRSCECDGSERCDKTARVRTTSVAVRNSPCDWHVAEHSSHCSGGGAVTARRLIEYWAATTFDFGSYNTPVKTISTKLACAFFGFLFGVQAVS